MKFQKTNPQRFSKLFYSFIFLFLITAQPGNAKIIFNPPTPYPQYDATATSFLIAIAGNPSGTPSDNAFVDNFSGFRFINTSRTDLAENWIAFDITSDSSSLSASTATQNLVVTLSPATGGAPLPIIRAGGFTGSTMPSACNGCQAPGSIAGTYYSVVYTAKTVLRVAIRLSDLCSVSGVTGTLCSGAAVADSTQTTLNQLITATIGLADASTYQGPTTAPSGGDSGQFTLYVTDTPPTISGPSLESQFYFPGDKEIILKFDNTTASVGNGVSSSVAGVPLYRYVELASLNASGGLTLPTSSNMTSWLTANSVPIHFSNYGIGSDRMPGFTNAESATDSAHDYSVAYYVENNAGLMSTTNVSLSSVKSQAISGILKESKCFIATATYHDGRAAPVMMLRQFRDEVLSKFSWGRTFIENYYHYSPALAEWAWDKPFVRAIALKVLTPIEFAAWVVLKISHAETGVTDADNAKTQPYIEHLKKKIEKEEAAKKKDKPEPAHESYIDGLKKKIGKDQQADSGSFIESIKKDLPPVEDGTGLTEKEKAKPIEFKERESTIKLVNEGRDKIDFEKKGTPLNAFSFKLGVNPGTEVFIDGGSPDLTYSTVYGNDWKPDFLFHYERALFNNPYAGTLAGSVDFGFNYAGGFGQLAFAFPSTGGTRQSQTRFSFIQLPFLVGGVYRINILKILRPYAGGSVGTVAYTEIRNDAQKDKRGYSFVGSFNLGVSLLLDYFDAATSKDAYLSDGIHHVYLFAEYLYLDTFSGSVIFKRGGVYSGFMFEF